MLIPTLIAIAEEPPEDRVTAPTEQAAESPAIADEEQKTAEQHPPITIDEARERLMRGDYEAAEQGFERLCREADGRGEACVGLAEVQLTVGHYAEALATLGEPGDQAPDRTGGIVAGSVRAHIVRARIYRILGRYEDAILELRASIEGKADNPAARRALGELLEYLGRRDEAIEVYRWFDRQLVKQQDLPADAAWLTDTAIGFYRYSVLTQTEAPRRTKHVLHDMLQPAYAHLDRMYWPARIAAGDLLREKYNNSEDDGSVSDYQAALRINENLCEAHVGLGEVMLTGWDFEKVEAHAERALKINPNHPAALHLLARKSILERRYERAIETCDRALAINADDLEAIAIRAAADACRYNQEGVEAMHRRALAIAPRSALYHRMLGDGLGGIRQYADSEREYLKAIELDGTDANARAELGMMYMQWGDEPKARSALDAAWVLDPYNKRTKFTLDLLTSLSGFAEHETEHFIVRFDAQKDPGLGPFVAQYLEGIYDELVGDYASPLRERTIIEMFPTQRAFAVRITGKPWIHTVGACTGRVIAMASPRESAELSGPYDFANVLRHEFTHTVTLAATKNRIPHWFTEGLAVLQEDSTRSFAWREQLAEAVRRSELFTLRSINWGFMRPKKPTDRQMAYAQSEWMCEYLIERFGYDIINEMLRLFRKGRTQEEVFTEHLKLPEGAFDEAFREWAKDKASDWCFDLTPPEDIAERRSASEAKPNDAALVARLAHARLDAGAYGAAWEDAMRALELDANQPQALTIVAQLLAEQARKADSKAAREALSDQALPFLQRLWDAHPTSRIAPKYLGEIYLRREQVDLAVDALTRLQQVCPSDPLSWRGLAGIYVQRGDDALALPQLTELTRLGADDAGVRVEIAKINRRKGRLREAQYWFRQALYVNPFARATHEALGDVSMQVGDTATALQEYTMLTELAPDHAAFFEKAAHAAHKLGDKTQAQAFARRAVALQPDSSARTLLP